jgi:epidermal growth factor receptor substrate 15
MGLVGTDLMGDDEAPSPVVAQPRAPASRSGSTIQPQATGPKVPVRDYSAEVGNAKNSLDSTTRAVESLQKEKAELEQKESSSAAQLKEIELRLSSVRAQHDNETRIVDDLKRRTREQTETLTKLRSDLISKESELSALRAEKDETEQALLRDKEEVRTMGKRMKEVQEETDKLKSLLEKMKKEARQQRGMVAIAKKQVQTVEGGRDAVQKEMDDVAAGKGIEEPFEQPRGLDAAARIISPQSTGIASPGNVATAASIPLPATPQQALSPVATGTTSRSNNPFDRLGFGGNAFAKAPAPSTGPQAFLNAFAPQAEASPVQDTRDNQTTGEATTEDHELSTLQKATLGAGAVAATVGGLAGAAVATVGSAFGVGGETHESHETQGQQADVAAGGDTLHEIAQHVKDGNDEELAPVSGTDASSTNAAGADTLHEIAQHVKNGNDEALAPASDANVPESEASGADTLHEIAQNVKDDTASEHSQSKSIDQDTQFQTRATESDDYARVPSSQSVGEQPEDPFGMSSSDRRGSDSTPTAETPSARQTEDPFGMPATASTGGFVTAQADNSQSKFDDQFESNFDQGFTDDFAKAPTGSSQAPTGSSQAPADFGNVTSPTADMHLAPASEPKSEFDSAFANAEKPVSAIPPQLRGLAMPQMAERTDSTRAVAPSSSVGTPFSEFAPSTPRSIDTASVSDDIRPAAQASAFDQERQGTPVASPAQRNFDAESSDEEDDGPEDLDRSRSPFSGAQYNAQPISSPANDAHGQYSERSVSPPTQNITSPASNPVPALANLGLGAPLEETHDSSARQAFPQTTESPFGDVTSTEKRRDPPPPPPARASGSQSGNPFASFAAAPAPPPASVSQAPFTASPPQAQPTSSFDDDFDFENLPSAQVAHGQTNAPVETKRSAVDFDDEFDDFNNDFEEIRPVSQQPAQTNNVALGSGAPQLPGFDDNFGLNKPVPTPAQPQRNAEKGFGFDDDFESAFT